ncbi:DUF2807 domain-containing protein [Rhizorhabdus wittichii]|uniref:DUF2807 domain-containing protein n=2 Tax=Rhizorhabdus wittichii TaxID=160791 RepID=A0A975HDA0_9SPHN|nr:DUF2807 domain-containing protein [Rhizorhabdus wittichii]
MESPMHRSITALLGLSLAAAVALPAGAATRSFPVPGFVKIRVEGPYTVRVRTGAQVSVRASGPANGIDRLVVEPRGQMLVVTSEKGWNWNPLHWNSGKIVVDVTVPMLEAAELTGPGDLTIDRIRTTAFSAALSGPGDLTVGRLDTSRLSASLTGPGNLTITGKTGRAEASLTGPGDIRAAGLAVDLLTATLTGPGTMTIGPTRVARATLTGPGDIRIAGRPSCTVKKTGPGSIKCGG